MGAVGGRWEPLGALWEPFGSRLGADLEPLEAHNEAISKIHYLFIDFFLIVEFILFNSIPKITGDGPSSWGETWVGVVVGDGFMDPKKK